MIGKLYRLFEVVRGLPQRLAARGDLGEQSTEQLMALMRHEAHRIEKTVYNKILEDEKKLGRYLEKRHAILRIQGILAGRGIPEDEPTVVWAKEICGAFDDLEGKFIQPGSTEPEPFQPEKVAEFIDFVRRRRSVRVWAAEQPTRAELLELALQLVDAARWAPNSGNRQPWRFKILLDVDQKETLRGLKEQHCISAPLLIFVGMDSRLYGALGKVERSIYIDAGAAVMQMVLAAHSVGYGVCWNHLADDLLQSRKSNIVAYKRFSIAAGIPEHIAPVAVVAIGRPAFIPPRPARMAVESLLIRDL